MIDSIIFLWLEAFDSYIVEMKDRKSLLLIDNPSNHGTKQPIPGFKNVEVCYLPSNTTSSIQHLEALIVQGVPAKSYINNS